MQMRKQQQINKQIVAHCKLQGADNPNASWDLVRNAIGRSAWYLFYHGITSVTATTLERICNELNLVVLVLEKETGKSAGGKEYSTQD